MVEIQIEILKGSLLEHDKLWKDYSYIYDVGHPRMKKIEIERNKIVEQIQKLIKP